MRDSSTVILHDTLFSSGLIIELGEGIFCHGVEGERTIRKEREKMMIVYRKRIQRVSFLSPPFSQSFQGAVDFSVNLFLLDSAIPAENVLRTESCRIKPTGTGNAI